MTEEKKPFVHELKAKDYFVEPPRDTLSGDLTQDPRPWNPIEELPRDGRTFEVICPDDRVYVVNWIEGRIVGGEDYPGSPLFWRQRS